MYLQENSPSTYHHYEYTSPSFPWAIVMVTEISYIENIYAAMPVGIRYGYECPKRTYVSYVHLARSADKLQYESVINLMSFGLVVNSSNAH